MPNDEHPRMKSTLDRRVALSRISLGLAGATLAAASTRAAEPGATSQYAAYK